MYFLMIPHLTANELQQSLYREDFTATNVPRMTLPQTTLKRKSIQIILNAKALMQTF